MCLCVREEGREGVCEGGRACVSVCVCEYERVCVFVRASTDEYVHGFDSACM